ncbi:MAG: cytochrome D ubiquinol oxidase subunit I [Polyangiaceae bacterium]|nr:cytochrome D ubiquinol oxidase subunit I [Polyangiaceae bacterium]
MLDGMLDHVAGVASGPVWKHMPDAERKDLDEPLPRAPRGLEGVYDTFVRRVLPYAAGNLHPRFFGWVHGGGNLAGMLGEMLAAGLDANLGGRDHAPVLIERQVVRWAREIFRFPETATGILVTGSSIANFMAVVVAKTARLGVETRKKGLAGHRLVAYTSSAAHGCVIRAMELSGLGSDALRVLPVDASHRLPVGELAAAIARDRAAGLEPFLVVASAGTVDTGAVDDLEALADLAAREKLWLHIDGALGSLGVLSPKIAPRLAGIERADSIALDFHKWLQVPYDAGFLLVRDGDAHRAAFAQRPAYLARAKRGLAAGEPWFTDFGPDLSRGFRALKVWFTIATYGADQLGAAIERTCALASRLGDRVSREPALELLAPVNLNVVCFRVRHADADRFNDDIVIDLQESGFAVTSTTRIDDKLAIRAAIVNHRTTESDIDALVDEVLRLTAQKAR